MYGSLKDDIRARVVMCYIFADIPLYFYEHRNVYRPLQYRGALPPVPSPSSACVLYIVGWQLSVCTCHIVPSCLMYYWPGVWKNMY